MYNVIIKSQTQFNIINEVEDDNLLLISSTDQFVGWLVILVSLLVLFEVTLYQSVKLKLYCAGNR